MSRRKTLSEFIEISENDGTPYAVKAARTVWSGGKEGDFASNSYLSEFLAITRAGKGQTIIEPTLDMWMRQVDPDNIVTNDPKGELLRKFYVRATVRGFQVIQFNLINVMKTDIYNRATRFAMKSCNF